MGHACAVAARGTVTLGVVRKSVPHRDPGVVVTRVVVDVMLKPEILDPEGRAIQAALARLGLEGVADVRQGKRFEITLDGPVEAERAASVERLAAELLANPVIEDYTLRMENDQ